MKALKTFLVFLFVGALLGAAVYLPLGFHVVTFQSKRHMVPKDSLGYNHTFLNLDRHQGEWKKVLKSPNLRGYFAKYYGKELQKIVKKQSTSIWKKLQIHGGKTLKLMKKGAKDLTQKALKHLKKVKTSPR